MNLENSVVFEVNAGNMPRVSMTDIAHVKPPYIHFSRQYHEYIFYYILEGEMYLREGEREYHLVEDDCILLDPTRRHVGYRTSVCNFLYVHFSQEIRELSADQKVSISKVLYTDTEDNKEKTRAEVNRQDIRIPKYYHMDEIVKIIRCREIAKNMTQLFRGHEPYDHMQAECLFQELLLIEAADYANSMYRKTVPVHGKVKEVIPQLVTYLNTSYQEEISGEMLSRRYHYHFDYLNRQFTKWTGSTIFHYLNTVRVERARQLLMTGFYSIEEVAAQTGFRDVYYFSRVFKKYTGVTPGQVRRE